jgi:TM2 domain-containing membrane protein YozV
MAELGVPGPSGHGDNGQSGTSVLGRSAIIFKILFALHRKTLDSIAPAGVRQTFHVTELTMASEGGSKRTTAGILAILVGWLGVHRFYMGDTKGGIFRILTNLLCLGGIIGLVEGIIYLTKTDAEFHEIYEVGKKEWF